MDKFSSILTNFANKINLGGLRIDPSGYCCLDVDNGTLVHIKYDNKRDGLILISEIGELPYMNRAAIMRYLLRMNNDANETKGMTLSFNTESGKAALGYQYPLRFLTNEGFEEVFKMFIDEVKRWVSRLEGFVQGQLPEGEESTLSEQPTTDQSSNTDLPPQFMIGA